MPIKRTQAPAPSFEELRAYMTDAHPDPTDHSPHIPHKVYTLDLDDLLAGNGLEAAYVVGWRYLFRGEDHQHRVVEVSVDEASDSHAFNYINTGSHVDSFIALVDHIDEHSTVQENEYEINLLRVPSCYVLAVWFTGVGHDHNFLIPLKPVHSNFEAGRHYEANEFMKLLQTTARAMAANPPVSLRALTNEDDLVRIEGIGPQLAALLKSNGITTFAQLAGSTVDQLQALMRHAGSRFNRADPTTWPEQAALAAAGSWQDLEKLQQQLKGGRN